MKTFIKNIAAFLLLSYIFCICISVKAQLVKPDIFPILKTHEISFNSYDTTRTEILIGNSRMGGPLNCDGLGFDAIWSEDFWASNIQRQAFYNFKLILSEKNKKTPSNYNQTLNLRDGIITTLAEYNGVIAYQSRVFFSKSNSNLLVMKIKNTSKTRELKFEVDIPEVKYSDTKFNPINPEVKITGNLNIFNIKRINKYKLCAHTTPEFFSQAYYEIIADQEIKESGKNNYFVTVPELSELTICFVFSTSLKETDYQKSVENIVKSLPDKEIIETEHKDAWHQLWEKSPVLVLPDKEYEKLWYRSVFWLHSVAGTSDFLPGESQFAVNCWNMWPFTYGAAGWSVYAFTSLGYFAEAKNMIKAHYKPEGLKQNAGIFVPLITGHLSPDALACAHEIDIFGKIRTRDFKRMPMHTQHDLQGFALGFIHQLYYYSQDKQYLDSLAYPFIKGIAEFWRSYIIWNETTRNYLVPHSLSVSENIVEVAVLDAVLAAKFSLKIASKYARDMNTDLDLAAKWDTIQRYLYIPQNDSIYLEFLGDDLSRHGGGYTGIRAPIWLGFPGLELIPEINKEKAYKMLDLTWSRNNQTEGMISFIANWFALAELYLGRADNASEYIQQNFTCYDTSRITICEIEKWHLNPYFLTSYASYILTPIAMVMQSYNGQIKPFPSVPSHWSNIEFYDFPAENGIKVSGKYINGEVEKVIFLKDNHLIHEQSDNLIFNIYDYL